MAAAIPLLQTARNDSVTYPSVTHKRKNFTEERVLQPVFKQEQWKSMHYFTKHVDAYSLDHCCYPFTDESTYYSSFDIQKIKNITGPNGTLIPVEDPETHLYKENDGTLSSSYYTGFDRKERRLRVINKNEQGNYQALRIAAVFVESFAYDSEVHSIKADIAGIVNYEEYGYQKLGDYFYDPKDPEAESIAKQEHEKSKRRSSCIIL